MIQAIDSYQGEDPLEPWIQYALFPLFILILRERERERERERIAAFSNITMQM